MSGDKGGLVSPCVGWRHSAAALSRGGGSGQAGRGAHMLHSQLRQRAAQRSSGVRRQPLSIARGVGADVGQEDADEGPAPCLGSLVFFYSIACGSAAIGGMGGGGLLGGVRG